MTGMFQMPVIGLKRPADGTIATYKQIGFREENPKDAGEQKRDEAKQSAVQREAA